MDRVHLILTIFFSNNTLTECIVLLKLEGISKFQNNVCNVCFILKPNLLQIWHQGIQLNEINHSKSMAQRCPKYLYCQIAQILIYL